VLVPEPQDRPSTFKVGLGAATGSYAAIHEISNLQINTINPLPELTLSMTPSAIAQRRLDFAVRGAVEEGSEGQPVTITTNLASGMTLAGLPSGKGCGLPRDRERRGVHAGYVQVHAE